MAVAAAAGAMAARQKRIVAAFRTAGATSPEGATTAVALRVHQGLAFRILRRRGVLREAGAERFYLDEAQWADHRSTRRKIALAIVGTVLLVASLVILLTVGR